MGIGFDFKLVEHARGECATVYSYCKRGRGKSEIERFWEKPDVRNAPDYDNLHERLYDDEESLLNSAWWADDFKLRDNQRHSQNPEDWGWLRNESDDVKDPDHPRYNLEALWAPTPEDDKKESSEPPSLRLYLFQVPDDRFDDPPYSSVFIIGNGDVKDVDQPHRKPELKSATRDARYVLNRMYERIEWQNDLSVTSGGLLLKGEEDDMYFGSTT